MVKYLRASVTWNVVVLIVCHHGPGCLVVYADYSEALPVCKHQIQRSENYAFYEIVHSATRYLMPGFIHVTV